MIIIHYDIGQYIMVINLWNNLARLWKLGKDKTWEWIRTDIITYITHIIYYISCHANPNCLILSISLQKYKRVVTPDKKQVLMSFDLSMYVSSLFGGYIEVCRSCHFLASEEFSNLAAFTRTWIWSQGNRPKKTLKNSTIAHSHFIFYLWPNALQ